MVFSESALREYSESRIVENGQKAMPKRKRIGIYPHGKGWRIQVKDPRTGKWKQIVTTRKRFEKLGIPLKSDSRISKEEAFILKQKYEEMLQLEATSGIPVEEGRLIQGISEYLKYQRNTPGFFKDKERVLGEFVYVVGNLPLGDVTKAHLMEFENHLRKEDRERILHNNSVARYLRYLRTFFNYCFHEGWIFRSPFLNFPLPTESPREIEPYRLEEIGEIVQWLKTGNREYVFWMVAGFVGLGLRSIELQGLTWKDFDPKERFVHISESKNPQSKRPQPVPLCLMHLFQEKQEESGPLFPTRSGDFPTRNQMNSLRTRVSKTFPKFRWGRFRKTYSTLLQKAGVDSLIIDRLLGHSSRSSSIRVSAQYYIGKEYAFYRDLVDEALEPFGEIFLG